jgi:hypothetical protein
MTWGEGPNAMLQVGPALVPFFPQLALLMPGNPDQEHRSEQRQPTPNDSWPMSMSKSQYTYRWTAPRDVVLANTPSVVIARIDRDMTIDVDGNGRWRVRYVIETYCPIYFWMDLSAYSQTSEWPLAHLLLELRPLPLGKLGMEDTGVRHRCRSSLTRLTFGCVTARGNCSSDSRTR